MYNMVYKTHLDYHFTTPNLPEIKSYVDSANAQRMVSQCPPSSGADTASPFMPDDLSSFSAPFSANDHVQHKFSPPVDSKPGFSWKTVVLCLSVFAFMAFLGYNQYSHVQYALNYAGYEMRLVSEYIFQEWTIFAHGMVEWYNHMLVKLT